MAGGFSVDDWFVPRRPGIVSARTPSVRASATALRYAFPPLDAPEATSRPPPQQQQPPPPPPPAPTFSEAELSAAVAAARREGFAAGEAAGRAEAEARLGAERERALVRLAERLAADSAAVNDVVGRRAVEAAELAVAVARAVVPAALAERPLADVEIMLRDCLDALRDEPTVELVLAPELIEPGEELLREAAAVAGFRGGLAVVADPALAPGDARLRWRDGWAERDVARLMAEAEALVRRGVAAVPYADTTNHDPEDEEQEESEP